MTEALVAERGLAEALRAPAVGLPGGGGRGAGDPDRVAAADSALLPHAEAREHPVQHLLDVHRPDQLVERSRRLPDVVGDEHRVARAAELRAARRPAPRAPGRAPSGAAPGSSAGSRSASAIRSANTRSAAARRSRRAQAGHRETTETGTPPPGAAAARSALVRTSSVGRSARDGRSRRPRRTARLDAEQHQVGRREVAPAHLDAQPVDPVGRIPQPGGVHQPDRPAEKIGVRLDRVARRAGNLGHQRALGCRAAR